MSYVTKIVHKSGAKDRTVVLCRNILGFTLLRDDLACNPLAFVDTLSLLHVLLCVNYIFEYLFNSVTSCYHFLIERLTVIVVSFDCCCYCIDDKH